MDLWYESCNKYFKSLHCCPSCFINCAMLYLSFCGLCSLIGFFLDKIIQLPLLYIYASISRSSLHLIKEIIIYVLLQHLKEQLLNVLWALSALSNVLVGPPKWFFITVVPLETPYQIIATQVFVLSGLILVQCCHVICFVPKLSSCDSPFLITYYEQFKQLKK